MTVVKTSSKGQIVIPKAIRKRLGITPGKRLLFRVVEDHAEIIPLPDDPIAALRGTLKGGKSLTKALLTERKKDNRVEHLASIMWI